MLSAASEHKLYWGVCASATVHNTLHHSQLCQPWIPRPENLEVMALILHFISLLSWGFSQGKDLHSSVQHLLVPALGGPHKHHLHWDTPQGTKAEKPFQNHHLCLCPYLPLEPESSFGFTYEEEPQSLRSVCPVPHCPLSCCPGSSPWSCLITFAFSIWQASSPLSLIIFKCLTALRP